MSDISDELREWIDDEDLYPAQIAELRRIAGRIESEMAELPVGADGRPIHVGDTVYGEDGDVVTDSDCLDARRVMYLHHIKCPHCGKRLRVEHELVPRFYASKERQR